MKKIKTIMGDKKVIDKYDIPVIKGQCKEADVVKTIKQYDKVLNRIRKEVIIFFKSMDKSGVVYVPMFELSWIAYKEYRKRLMNYVGITIVREMLKEKEKD